MKKYIILLIFSLVLIGCSKTTIFKDGTHTYSFSKNTTTTNKRYIFPDVEEDIDNFVYTYSERLNGYIIHYTKEKRFAVKIPEKINGIPVVYLDSGLFSNDDVLNYLYIPSTITDYSFWFRFGNIKNLKYEECGGILYLNKILVKNIDTNRLIIDNIKEGTNVVNSGAFSGHYRCENIILPDSIKTIKNSAFFNQYLTSVNIPEGVTKLETSTFYSMSIRLSLPSTLEYISKGASYYSYYGNNEYIEDNVVYEGVHALRLNELKENDTVIFKEGTKTINPSGFQNRENIVEIIIPEGITTISKDTFYGCTNIARVYLPSSLRIIEDDAFDSSCNIEFICPNSSLEYVGNVFTKARRYIYEMPTVETHMNDSLVNKDGLLYFDKNLVGVADKNLTTVNLSDDTISISPLAFAECHNLEEVVVPSSVKYIGETAFYNCQNLKSIYIGKNVKYIGYYLENYSIFERSPLFDYCPNMETLVVDSENIYYHSENNCIIDTDWYGVCYYTKNAILPSDNKLRTGYGPLLI